MLGPLYHTIRKEFLVLIRDPASRAMVFIVPIVQLLVFSFAATMEVRNVDIAIVDNDRGAASFEFLQRVEAASFVGRVLHLQTLEETRELIDRRDVLLALHFQPDYSRQLAAGEPASVQLLIDGRRANAGQIVLSYIQTIAAELQSELALERGITPPAVAEQRHWYNPNLEYWWFIVPALVTTLAFIPAMSISVLSVARDRELGTLDQLVVSPVSTSGLILGKVLPPVIAGLISSLLVFVMAITAYQIPFTGNFLILMLALPVFLLAVSGFGIAISAACNTQQQAMMGLFTFTVPMFVTSGFVTPVENMPDALQLLSEINPLKHAMVVIQSTFLQAPTLKEAARHIWPMLIISMVTLGMAGGIIRWRVQ